MAPSEFRAQRFGSAMRLRIAFLVSLRLDDVSSALHPRDQPAPCGTRSVGRLRFQYLKIPCFLNPEFRRLLAPRLNGGDFGEIWWEIVCGECLDIHFD